MVTIMFATSLLVSVTIVRKSRSRCQQPQLTLFLSTSSLSIVTELREQSWALSWGWSLSTDPLLLTDQVVHKIIHEWRWSECWQWSLSVKEWVKSCLFIPGHFEFWVPVPLQNASRCVTFICTMHCSLSLCAKLDKRKKLLHKVDICEKSKIWAQSGHTNWRTEFGDCGQHGFV